MIGHQSVTTDKSRLDDTDSSGSDTLTGHSTPSIHDKTAAQHLSTLRHVPKHTEIGGISWGYQLSEKKPRITEVRIVQRRVLSRSDCI